jgi:succinate dehydrogenase / fumarate reductase flavoprotein subunit
MGGLWVDYNLMSTIPGLHVLGEANFSDHGANRLGASALMQGLSDGYFVIPYTIGDYLAGTELKQTSTDNDAFKETVAAAKEKDQKLLSINGNKTVKEFHRDIGNILWNHVGMGRDEEGLKKALVEIPKLRDEFWQNVKVAGTAESMNKNLEFAGRVVDYMELAELMAVDALHRKESCGGHFREESQTEDGEALRDDEIFSYVAAWEFHGLGKEWTLHKEPLVFENVTPTQRSYK